MPIELRKEVLRTVMAAVGEGVMVWSVPAGVLVTCNEAAARILGVERSEIAGRPLDFPWTLAHEDGLPLPQNARGAYLAVQIGRASCRERV